MKHKYSRQWSSSYSPEKWAVMFTETGWFGFHYHVDCLGFASSIEEENKLIQAHKDFLAQPTLPEKTNE